MKILLLITLLLASVYSLDKCRALALEGGGDKGAYQVGVLKGFLQQIPDDIHYDVVSGVSVGALNSIAFAVYEKGDEAQAIQFLEDLWTDISSDDVYRAWPGLLGVLRGFYDKPSLFDTTPLLEYLEKKKTENNFTIKRPAIASAVNADTGSYDAFNDQTLSIDEFLNAVVASASIPAAFPFTVINDHNYMDGGTVRNLNIEDAINYCRDQGFEDNQIIVDAILCSNDTFENIESSGKNSIQMILRYIDLSSYWKSLHYIDDVKYSHPNVTLRYVVGPSQSLPSGLLPIKFNKENTLKMIEIGIKDAKTKIAEGSGVMAEAIHRMMEEKALNEHDFRKATEFIPQVQEEFRLRQNE